MRQTHLAGEKLFVDFAGDTIAVVDPSTGRARAVKLSVAAQRASNYTFAEARESETLPDWIGAHVNLVAALGGVPQLVICDNLKAAVTAPPVPLPGRTRLAGRNRRAASPRRSFCKSWTRDGRGGAARERDSTWLVLWSCPARYALVQAPSTKRAKDAKAMTT